MARTREATDRQFFGDFLRGVPTDLATRRIGLLLWGVPILALAFTALERVGPRCIQTSR